MKTIFAFSDTHGLSVSQRLLSIMNESDYVFFCGDGLAALINNLDDGIKNKFYAVRGNCDGGIKFADVETVAVEGVKFMLTHGHRYSGKTDMCYAAKELGCACVLYGHTHSFGDETVDGVRLINIGSLCDSYTDSVGYVYIVVDGKNIFVNFVKTA